MPQNNVDKNKNSQTLNSIKKKNKNKKEYEKLKQKYFDYYDDVKSHTHNVYDWWCY